MKGFEQRNIAKTRKACWLLDWAGQARPTILNGETATRPASREGGALPLTPAHRSLTPDPLSSRLCRRPRGKAPPSRAGALYFFLAASPSRGQAAIKKLAELNGHGY
jgi:hypothetical protein